MILIVNLIHNTLGRESGGGRVPEKFGVRTPVHIVPQILSCLKASSTKLLALQWSIMHRLIKAIAAIAVNKICTKTTQYSAGVAWVSLWGNLRLSQITAVMSLTSARYVHRIGPCDMSDWSDSD
jgi:hypothetical protein